jgi:polysaccharide biosynthesis protein PslA
MATMFIARHEEYWKNDLQDLDSTCALPGLQAAVIPPATLRSAAWELIKRVEDIIIASIALLVLGAPMLIVGLLIRVLDPGPALFHQQRIGLDGRSFTLLKFRTMHHRPGGWTKLMQATEHDPRVTRIGAVLRRTSFDEAPQFINVLLGDMSIVGPRPHAPGTCAAGIPFEQVTSRYAIRHCVKPGMTGLAQVRGWRGETDTIEKFLHRLECDLEYIAHRNPWSDLWIICLTIAAVARMRNAW